MPKSNTSALQSEMRASVLCWCGAGVLGASSPPLGRFPSKLAIPGETTGGVRCELDEAGGFACFITSPKVLPKPGFGTRADKIASLG